ncbi:MAG: hypothetical protein IJH12_08300 [Clostridia bacterium]|nr:hypothetical protein [Clostridia bacterium]
MIDFESTTIKRSFTELNYIINNMSESIRNKIPEDLIKMIARQKDDEYILNIDITKKYSEQNYMPETKAFISVLLSDYICDDSIKDKWKGLDKKYEDVTPKEINVSCNTNNSINIFENRNSLKNIETIRSNDSNKQLIEVKEGNFFRKFIRKLKCFFGKS